MRCVRREGAVGDECSRDAKWAFAVVYFPRTASVAAFIKELFSARFHSVFPRESFNFQRRNSVSARIKVRRVRARMASGFCAATILRCIFPLNVKLAVVDSREELAVVNIISARTDPREIFYGRRVLKYRYYRLRVPESASDTG